MANSGGLKTSKHYISNHASHLLHLHDRSREVVSVWIRFLPFATCMWESEETPIQFMRAWHINSLSWKQMSALFMNVGSNVGYNSTVGIATSEMNSDQTFVVSSCSWFVFPSLSQWPERGQVWDFLQCSAVIITFAWERRHLLKCSHCSSTYVNRNPSMPGAARIGVWQQCLSPGSSQPSQARRKWRIPCAGWWESQDLGKAMPVPQILSHKIWPKPTRP